MERSWVADRRTGRRTGHAQCMELRTSCACGRGRGRAQRIKTCHAGGKRQGKGEGGQSTTLTSSMTLQCPSLTLAGSSKVEVISPPGENSREGAEIPFSSLLHSSLPIRSPSGAATQRLVLARPGLMHHGLSHEEKGTARLRMVCSQRVPNTGFACCPPAPIARPFRSPAPTDPSAALPDPLTLHPAAMTPS